MPCARADPGAVLSRSSGPPATYATGPSRTMGSTPHGRPVASPAPWSQPNGRAATEATGPAGIRPQGAQEVDVAEVGPVRLAEVELGGRALPQQEAAEALLPRRADDEVGVGLALGVEVLGDVLDGELSGDLLDRLATSGACQQQVAH